MTSTSIDTAPRHDWQLDEVRALFALPFNDLVFKAQTIHRAVFDPNKVQLSTLLNIKTGKCSEDCAYCPQSAHFKVEVEPEPLMNAEVVVEAAKKAKENGASRFCMGAAWRSPKRRDDFDKVLQMVRDVKAQGLETCVTLGMLTDEQTAELKEAGLDYYNHNLDTSAAYYSSIITTRTYQDRLDTLEHVRDAGIKVCSGGIIGMGESDNDRASMLQTLANLPQHPESVPINQLVKVAGTPLEHVDDTDPLEFVRCVAVARILLPQSFIRLSAGRESMSDELQALCFFAGANSMFYGEKLLVTDNPDSDHDNQLLSRLGMEALQ